MVTHAVLQVDGLCFGYPGRQLWSGLACRIPPGVTLVRGGDGAGKTTFLRLLAGDLAAQAGILQVNGVRLDSQPDRYRQQVLLADPRPGIDDQRTPRQVFQSSQESWPAWNAGLLSDLCDGLSLVPHLDKPLYMLSTGSKRKVWLATAFAAGAAVTLLDGPFAALDKASIEVVLDLLDEAADHPSRSWVIADYEPPACTRLAATMDLGD